MIVRDIDSYSRDIESDRESKRVIVREREIVRESERVIERERERERERE